MLKPIGDFKIGWEKSYFKLDSFHGEVTEWLNVAVSKTAVRACVPRVRIPLSPPFQKIEQTSNHSRVRKGNSQIITASIERSYIIHKLDRET